MPVDPGALWALKLKETLSVGVGVGVGLETDPEGEGDDGFAGDRLVSATEPPGAAPTGGEIVMFDIDAVRSTKFKL